MDFDFTEEQGLLRDSVSKLLANHYADFEKRRGYAKQEGGFDQSIWAEYAEAGLLALPFSEDQGGFGGGPVETMIVMEEIGRSLALEPFLPSVVFGGAIIRHGAPDDVKADLIPKLAGGEAILAVAHTERHSRFDLADITTTARREGESIILEGDKTVVVAGDSATHLIVSARLSGGTRDRDGVGLFLVPADAEGVSRRGYKMQDALHGAEISLASVRIPATRQVGDLATLERAADETIAALCAEAIGAMDALVHTTVDYMKQRKQFGVAIASFQALQHRAVDMYVALEQAHSMAIFAALSAAEPDPKARSESVSMAKAAVGRAIKTVGQQAIQLHGGIAVTEEYKAGHYFKRLTMIDLAFGDADYHQRRLAA